MGSIAHDDSLVTEVRQAFEELEHGHAGVVKNSILLQVLPCLALPCLALPCLALPCLALPCHCYHIYCPSPCPGHCEHNISVSCMLCCLLFGASACSKFHTYVFPSTVLSCISCLSEIFFYKPASVHASRFVRLCSFCLSRHTCLHFLAWHATLWCTYQAW